MQGGSAGRSRLLAGPRRTVSLLLTGLPVPVGVLLAGSQQGGHLVLRKRHRRRFLDLGAFQLERQIFLAPATIHKEAADGAKALQFFPPGDRSVLPLPPESTRSEEHTSELQSL